MTNKLITEIMQKINKNEIKPHSRLYFLAGLIALIFGTFSFFILSSFFVNTLFYNFDSYRNPFLGINPLVPWPAIFITLLTFGVGIFLFRKFEISYKKSFIVLFTFIVFTVALSGYFISKTNLNQNLLTNREYKKMYMRTLREEDWIQGTIIEKKDAEFQVKDSQGDLYSVKYTDDTIQPNRPFEKGDCIKAVGSVKSNTIIAKGLSKCGKGKGMGNGMNMMRNNKSN